MIWRTVMKLEWRILKRDRSALAVLTLFAGLLVLASLAGGRHADTLALGLERSQTEELDRWDTLTDSLIRLEKGNTPIRAKDPRDPVWMGEHGAARLATLPPAPLAPIAVGQRDLHPQAVQVTTEMNLTTERKTETPMSGPTKLRTGAFDPAFLFVILFPLVIIALSYELLSGERERGTLAMLLSQPVSQTQLVMGKAGARALALSLVTLLFALAGLLLAGADLSEPDAWKHVGLYAGILVVWALFWFAAAIAVNAWSPSSARNALTLVGLWLVLVVVVPGLVHVAVDTLYPPPSKIELLHEAREAAQEVESKLNDMQGRHDVNPQQEGYAARVVQVQEELASRSEPVLAAMREKIQERQDLVNTLRFTSPAIVVQLAMEDVAGSGSHRHTLFEEEADAFHGEFRGYFVKRISSEKPFSTHDLKGVPKMIFQEEGFGSLGMRVGSGIAFLMFLTGLLLAIAWPGLQQVGRLAR